MAIEFKYDLGEEVVFCGKSVKILFRIYAPAQVEPFYGILLIQKFRDLHWMITPEQIERFFNIAHYSDVEVVANISDYYGQYYFFLDEKDIRKQ